MMRELNFTSRAIFWSWPPRLFIPSRRLLPQDDAIVSAGPDELPTSEEELIRRLNEYKRFQELGRQIQALPMVDRETSPRPGVLPPERQTTGKRWTSPAHAALTDVPSVTLTHARDHPRGDFDPERINQIIKILKPTR